MGKSPLRLLYLLFLSLRPTQWTKNLVVFAGLIFTARFVYWSDLLRTLATALDYCLLSGSLYIINDCWDREKDQHHPKKKQRPIASGELPLSWAVPASLGILIFSLTVAWLLDPRFFLIAVLYLLLNLGYSFGLREVVILDILIVSSGFVLRAVAGAVVIRVEISSWLIMCTVFLSLLLSLGKRRQEKISLKTPGAHRPLLEEYSVSFLDTLILLVTAGALMSYVLFTFAPGKAPQTYRHPYMWITLPYVFYGLFRYLYLLFQKGEGGSPTDLLLQDYPLLITVVLWALSSAVLIWWETAPSPP